MNLLQTLNFGYNTLKQNSIKTYKLDTELLLAQCLNISKEQLILNLNKNISINDYSNFIKILNRRKKKEPVAYILKNKEFWKNKFYVDKSVLIPRPETEHLVEQAIKILGKFNKKRVLEIGIGSGCLILSILKELKYCTGVGIDKSKKAVNIANFNAKLHQIQNRIRFIKSDVDNFNTGTYDLIISNPPYIDKHQLKRLSVSVYEPTIALDGGLNGMDVLVKVILKSSKLLKINGKLILEIGSNQKYKVTNFLKKNNFYIEEIKKDLSNHDRCILSTKLAFKN